MRQENQRGPVLLVEHFAPLRVRLLQKLRESGFLVTEAVNVQEGLYHLQKGVPFSFIVDGSEKDGLGLVRGLGNISKTKDRPVLLIIEAPQVDTISSSPPLHPAVIPIIKYKVVDDLVNAVVAAQQYATASASPLVVPDPPAEPEPIISPAQKKEVDALEKAFASFDDIVDRIAKNKLPGPMVPTVLQKVREIIANPEAQFKEISAFAKQHQAISSKLLTMANTAFYSGGNSEKISSIQVALSRLGLDKTSSVLQAVASQSFLVGKDEKLREMLTGCLRTSYAVGVVSSELAGIAKHQDTGRVYTIGLFHNIGETFLLYTLASLQEQGEIESIDYTATQTMLQSRAGELNEKLSQTLKLPSEVGKIFSAPDAAKPPQEIAFVHQAMWAAKRILASEKPDPLVRDAEAEVVGLGEEALRALNERLANIAALLNAYM